MALVARIIYEGLLRRETSRCRLASAAHQAENGHPAASLPAHLDEGRRGERLAYWYLRRMGYKVVARNLRGRHGAGELDLVAWDGPILAFVEVKTRSGGDARPPQALVTFDQQRRIAAAAQVYIRGLKQKAVNYRFDMVSVAWDQREGYRVQLIQDAFRG